MKHYTIEQSAFSHFLFSSTKSSIFWFVLRIYVGWIWLLAGWEKIQNPAWVGTSTGQAITGFINEALSKTIGPHPDVQGWYANFLNGIVLPHAAGWSYLVAYGEFLVGLGLITGTVVGIAAFFGLFMNLNFLMAGTVSINPILLTLSIGLILAWRIAGFIGFDYFVLPALRRHFNPGPR